MNLEAALVQFGASTPEPLAQTPRAYLWRVQHASGPAVLKIATPVGRAAGEVLGAQALALWKGQSAAQVYALSGDALLMEALTGPSLGDMSRGGQDIESASILTQVAGELRGQTDPRFPDLRTYSSAVFNADASAFSTEDRAAFERAKHMWRHLLDTVQTQSLLHADLHHDNILYGARGWCVIDPKGVNGDPCYDFANAFRNPVGMEKQAADPNRILALAEVFAQGSGLDRARILSFGFAHVALSFTWNKNDGLLSRDDFAMLRSFDKLCRPLLP